MALVPFRVSGPAASQQLEQQLLQVGPHSLLLQQRPHESGNTEHLKVQQQQQQRAAAAGSEAVRPDLSRVGLVLWQSGFVLSDFLLQRLPQLLPGGGGGGCCWPGTRVLELGCGAGTVGMFLARAGAWVSEQGVVMEQHGVRACSGEYMRQDTALCVAPSATRRLPLLPVRCRSC